MHTSPNREIPDGGWGWVVVAGVAFINMTNQSILSVCGLLFGEYLNSTLTVALIANLNSFALNFSGIFIGPAIKNFNPRNVAATGCTMVSFGMLLCSFGTSTWHFVVGYSFFVGVGLGLIGPSTFIVINSYFNSKRGRAVGISLAGAGLGQVFIPHLVRLCLDYGFHVAAMAISMLSLSGLLGAVLLRPLTSVSADTEREILQIKPKELNLDHRTENQNICYSARRRLIQAMDLDLLRDPVFLNIIIGMALVYTSTINFTMLFPNFLQFSVGLSSSNTATCMSVIAGADIFSRLTLPWITDTLKISYRLVFLMGTAGLLIARTGLAESVGMKGIFTMCILTGVTKSATVLNNNLTITGYCHSNKIAGGLGLNMIAKGIFVISIGQILGLIRDYSQSYVYCLHAQNMLLGLVLLIWTPEMYYRHRKLNKTADLTKADEFCEELDRMNPHSSELAIPEAPKATK